MKKKILVWMLIAATSIGAVGCGSSKYDSAAPEAAYSKNAGYETNSMDYAATEEMVAYEGDYYDEMGDSPAASVTEDTRTSENASTSNRKLIRDVTLNVETKEYDALIGTLSEEITALGGYIEYMDVHNSSYRSSNTSRNANLTVRIPAAKLDGFLNKMGAETNVTSRTESVRDVTLTYVDMESHKNVLIAERERLLEYLNQAETVEDMMAIEDHLASVRYQIESMESQLRTYDNQVDYSTVNIFITEVIDYTPVAVEEETTWERISQGFERSLKDVLRDIKEFFIDLVIDLPYIILALVKIAIVVIILRLIIFRNKKVRAWFATKKEERKAYKAEKKAAKAAKKAQNETDNAGESTPEETAKEGVSADDSRE